MSDAKLTQDDVQQILRLIHASEHVAEFHLKFGDVEIALSREGGAGLGRFASPVPSAAASAVPTPAPPPPSSSTTPAPASNEVPPGATAIKAPMVGTFYRAPAPGAPPFVEVDARVEPDTTVCIIEVMKLMNSIPAGVRGTVREIRVDDAQAVEFGQVLIVIDPEAER